MMEMTSPGDKAIARILELSADLQIKRRATTKYSLAYHDYSVAIATCGEVLEALTTVQQGEEYLSATFGLLGSLQSPQAPSAVL